MLDATVRTQARQQLATAFDPVQGGFGVAPKFPQPSELAFFLRRAREEGDHQARDMALLTLRKMAEGGLYDQIGGGNGVLLALYADALALTGEPLFRRVVVDTAAWALREMRSRPMNGMCAPPTGVCLMRPTLKATTGTCLWRALPPCWPAPCSSLKCRYRR